MLSCEEQTLQSRGEWRVRQGRASLRAQAWPWPLSCGFTQAPERKAAARTAPIHTHTPEACESENKLGLHGWPSKEAQLTQVTLLRLRLWPHQ